MGLRAIVFKEQMSRHVFNITPLVFWRTILIGAVAGAITWLLSIALDRFMITPVFCSGTDNISACTNSVMTATYVASVLVGIMTIPVLAMTQTKRAFLVVLMSTAALWGLAAWLAGSWITSLFWTVLTYATVYALMVWVNRLRSGFSAVLVMALVVFVSRFVLSL